MKSYFSEPQKFLVMLRLNLSITFSSLTAGIGVILLCGTTTLAQSANPPTNTQKLPPRTANDVSAEKSSPSDDGPPLTTFEEEIRAKQAIKLAEKEHQQNLERAREISKLGKDLQARFNSLKSLDREGLKRLERLEKLTKKIRGEAGGESDEIQIVNRPQDKSAAISQINEMAESLSQSVLSTPRQVVSAAVIDGANVLLELIKLFRTFPQ